MCHGATNKISIFFYPNLSTKSTLHYPFGFSSDISFLITIFKKLASFICAKLINAKFNVRLPAILIIGDKFFICSF